jgi:D-beta-D-heptose 7-phosphate kinase / D-beta-D-heptose 1-phosphate adenosyltransferase
VDANEILAAIPGKHIAVVGDPILDEYHFGRVERICPEAPVPVFIRERSEMRPGGAANVANQLRALGCHALELYPSRESVKTRFMAGSHMLLRVDDDVFYTPTADDVYGVSKVIQQAPALDALILSDYAHGWLSFDMCQAAIDSAFRRGLPIIIDPKKDDWRKFHTLVGTPLICPSGSEYTAGFPFGMDVLHKQGAAGMTLHENRKDYGRTPEQHTHIPAIARHVFDVTGAGDTVVAVVAAAVAAGASYLEAAQLAAVAAGYVVGEVGTTVCPFEKLKELVNAD